jgi:hypothetical protein
MRRFILAGGLAAVGLTAWSAPADGAVRVTLAPATPLWAVGDPDGRPADEGGWPTDWLWDLMLDRLTVPLGPADQNIWPQVARWEQSIATAADRGGVVERRPTTQG